MSLGRAIDEIGPNLDVFSFPENVGSKQIVVMARNPPSS